MNKVWQKIKFFLFGLFYENEEPSLTRCIIASAFVVFIIGTVADIIMALFGKAWSGYQTFATITGGGSISAKIADRITNTVSSQAWGSPKGQMPTLAKNPITMETIKTGIQNASSQKPQPERYPFRQITLADLRTLLRQSQETLLTAAADAAGGCIKTYVHWTAGHYRQYFNDYHLLVDFNGEVLTTVENLGTRLSHTYRRNSGAIAIAALCAYNAKTCDDLGPEPPTDAQIEAIAQLIAVISQELDLPITIEYFLTHAEAADNMDGENPGYAPNGYPEGKYGPNNSVERWDLWVVKAGDEPGSGGNILRGKANWYLQNGLG